MISHDMGSVPDVNIGGIILTDVSFFRETGFTKKDKRYTIRAKRNDSEICARSGSGFRRAA